MLPFQARAGMLLAQADMTVVPATLYLTHRPAETYEQLLIRAKQTALNRVGRLFSDDASLMEMSLLVLVESNNGTIVPLLTMRVSRSQWQQQRNPDAWISTLNGSKVLLGLGSSAPISANQAQPQVPIPREQTDSYRRNVLPPDPPGSPL